MGKTFKGKAKAKAKVEKAKRKIARKCKSAAVLFAAMLGVVLAGCQAVPSRSQTLTIKDCVVNVYGGMPTNTVATVEFGTQAMSIENSGTETQSPTQTTDTKPDIDVAVGGVGGGTASEVAKSVAAGAQAVTAVANACTDGSCNPGGTSSAVCVDGNCSP